MVYYFEGCGMQKVGKCSAPWANLKSLVFKTSILKVAPWLLLQRLVMKQLDSRGNNLNWIFPPSPLIAQDNAVLVWKMKPPFYSITHHHTLRGHSGAVTAVKMEEKNKLVVSGSRDSTLKVSAFLHINYLTYSKVHSHHSWDPYVELKLNWAWT